LWEFFAKPPYPLFFEDIEELHTLFAFLEQVEVPTPLLHTVGYFKKKDFYTYRHIITVFGLSALLTKNMIKDKALIEIQSMAAPFHDIGKINIPMNIIQKKTPLTEEELNILKQHTVSGYVLLSYYFKDLNHPAALVARDHHERRDGSGYPCSISQKNRTIEIIAVCDIFDALISKRSYRPSPYDQRSAIEELTRLANNGIIDIEVVKILIALVRKDKKHFSLVDVSTQQRGSEPEGNLYGILSED
ncbi:MAG: HD domain-containing protein, partial [Desulfamplus sp.]|nr:HD domain-containing protein [Desulfamplus sp.]